MDDVQDVIPLPELPRLVGTRYRMIYAAAIEGHFPAHRIGRNWVVWKSDLPAIIEHFAAERVAA